jgi:YfiH family protein
VSAPLLLPFGAWLGPGVQGFTSTRQGGWSSGAYDSLNLGANTDDDPAAVLANREAAFQTAGLDPKQSVYLQQVHGAAIHEALADDAGRGLLGWQDGLPACDAVFTRQKGLGLSIGHADCLAVVLVDAEAGLLGLAHAGWRGALAQLPASLAGRLVKEGADPARLKAVLSPCLSAPALELGEEQHRLFTKAFSKVGDFATTPQNGKFHLDLVACATRQLLEAGVPAPQILAQPFCTSTHAELFYSHRRDQGKTGRHLTAAWLE